eukprot:CAMPEP_0172190598 /NCGR_PEP_ID=MMETSP1050-20130122/23208_1 /TAXON_ID=233186 /ORGANISM="Cryptomonas curvata, Strain CCAP979/52" /LENGTH=295 /DNA_ID=CAMNT_0012865501 /DNA_START=161 /DNA_END=1048 /DNA_ORIENTATION=+
MKACGLIDWNAISSISKCVESRIEFSQNDMISAMVEDLDLKHVIEPSQSNDDTKDKSKAGLATNETRRKLLFCCAAIADQVSTRPSTDLNLASEGPDTAEEYENVGIVGSSDHYGISFARESFECFKPGNEANVKLYTLLSPLCTTTTIRPDIWFKVKMGIADVPVLMVEIVSGSQGQPSVEQTIRKQICNTVDQLRFYMNLRESPVSEVSSIVFPKDGGLSSGVTVVTARFPMGGRWKMNVTLQNIQKIEVCDVMKKILKQHIKFLRSGTSHKGPWYLVKIYDLPPETVQVARA